MFTYTVSYVGMLKSYEDQSQTSVKEFAVRKPVCRRWLHSKSRGQAVHPFEAADVPTLAVASVPLPAYSESEPKFHGGISLRESTMRSLWRYNGLCRHYSMSKRTFAAFRTIPRIAGRLEHFILDVIIRPQLVKNLVPFTSSAVFVGTNAYQLLR